MASEHDDEDYNTFRLRVPSGWSINDLFETLCSDCTVKVKVEVDDDETVLTLM